jgi:hypothetical protein
MSGKWGEETQGGTQGQSKGAALGRWGLRRPHDYCDPIEGLRLNNSLLRAHVDNNSS